MSAPVNLTTTCPLGHESVLSTIHVAAAESYPMLVLRGAREPSRGPKAPSVCGVCGIVWVIRERDGEGVGKP